MNTTSDPQPLSTSAAPQATAPGIAAGASGSEALETIAREVARAKSKHPTWPTDPLHALAVLGEEFGELTKEMLQLTYEPHKSTKETVRAEAIQTAAMALRLVASLDRYEYRRGPQHRQDEPHRVPCAACDRGDFSWGHADDCPQNTQAES